MEKQNNQPKPPKEIDKAALEIAKIAHERAKGNNKIVRK